jgi:Ran GTPase-activating protein (RanGAP) involved in mRNA processing and transport
MQPLQSLTRLVDLRLSLMNARGERITTSMLSGTHNLTHLSLPTDVTLEPGALTGKTRLQHLELDQCDLVPFAGTGVAQLLPHLQHLQQLTYLSMTWCLQADADGNLPATAYSALTASSKLQHLDISNCVVPIGVWHHMFPVGKVLAHLHDLNIL